MSSPRQIAVTGEQGYTVQIGHGVRNELPQLLAGASQVLLAHPPTLPGQAEQLRKMIAAQGLSVTVAAVPDGEAGKSLEVCGDLWSQLGRAAFTRTDAVVGLGGGAVTDLAGFVAAGWLRGVPVVQVPTTVLGMVDAAVGGKTGINTAEGKNLVGAFHPPSAVLCDLDYLATLPDAELRPGLAEVVKCGFIADPVILDLIETDPDGAADPASDLLAELVARSVQVKAQVVSADLKESGLREILNYGHTFAHAIEQVEGYTWRHGNAVSVGMVYVAELARLAGRLEPSAVARHRSVLTALGLPVGYPKGRWDELHTAMRRDKKTRGGTLRFVVLDGVGEPARLAGPPQELLQQAYEQVWTAG